MSQNCAAGPCHGLVMLLCFACWPLLGQRRAAPCLGCNPSGRHQWLPSMRRGRIHTPDKLTSYTEIPNRPEGGPLVAC